MIFLEAFKDHFPALITFAILIFSLGGLVVAAFFIPKENPKDEDGNEYKSF